MNEEDLDLLASAFVDGEATSEEVAMVERDPALAARVRARADEFRAVDEQIGTVPPPSAQLKEQHLAAVLAEFDTVPRTIGNAPATVNVTGAAAPAAVTASDGAEIIDLANRSAKREQRRRRWFGDPGAVPSFVTAAAAVVLIGGGVVFAANQLGTGDGSVDTAAADFAETEDAAEESVDEGADALNESRAVGEEGDAAMELADEATADEEEAMEDDAMEEEAASDESADSDAAASSATTTTEATAPAESEDGGDAETTEGGLFPNESVMSFDQAPDADEAMSEMPERRTDLFRSLCADSLTLPDGSEVVAFAPIDVGGEPAELFVIIDDDGRESGLIVDGACGAMDG